MSIRVKLFKSSNRQYLEDEVNQFLQECDDGDKDYLFEFKYSATVNSYNNPEYSVLIIFKDITVKYGE